MKFNFSALEHIVVEDPLLTEIEAYLRELGHRDLADKLNKFQQDAGAKVFNDIGNGEEADTVVTGDINKVIEFTDGELLEVSDPIIRAFEEFTEKRGEIFTEIAPIIEIRGGALHEKYQDFLRTLRKLASPKASPGVDLKTEIKPV